MTKFLSAVVLLVSGLVLTSCVPLGPPFIFDDSHQKADARMEQIVEALNGQDAAELKEMFSTYALDQATGVDEGLEYLLSFFPGGDISWERDTVNSSSHNRYGKKSELLRSYYVVSVDGDDYWFFFADFTVNEVENPDNVGIYALGVTPWAEDLRSGAAEPFFAWAGAIHLEGDDENGYPGIYVPEER